MRIPFNKPFIAGKELYYIAQAVAFGNIGGDGQFTKTCERILEKQFDVDRALMTPSCTAALEMAAMLCDLRPGDEVIMPSYTFVSTANAFVLRGAKPVFVDVRPDTLNIDEELIEPAITERTKVICPVHYAGVGCEMDRIMEIADKYSITIVEDAAQGVNASYKGKPLGSIGHLGAYSFHETKNYICGEGGALCVNRKQFVRRAEIIHDKGTNRQAFFRGDIDKYTWVDIGSSYVLSELSCAFLAAQLEALDSIQNTRERLYATYREGLHELELQGHLRLPVVPFHCKSNCHMFYILLSDEATRDEMLFHLRERGIHSVFHYVPLHSSEMGQQLGYREGQLPITEQSSGKLLRLPFYHDLAAAEQHLVIDTIKAFFN